jgi:enoyl-CoA hydratase/carnithine racemase
MSDRVGADTTSRTVDLSVTGPVARITLSRPEKLNPFDWTTILELRQIVDRIEHEPEIRVVTVTGSGRSFSAGGDLGGYLKLYREPDQFQAFLADFHALLTTIEASARIYIAVINGLCVAGGLEFFLACDMVIAADTARIGDGHLNFGQLPGAGGSQRLPRAIGVLRAKQLMFSGALLSAAEAERIGLIGKVVPAGELESYVETLCFDLLQKSRVGLAGAKHLLNESRIRELSDGLQHEMSFVHSYATQEPDAIEGLEAFRDKRKPQFDRGE